MIETKTILAYKFVLQPILSELFNKTKKELSVAVAKWQTNDTYEKIENTIKQIGIVRTIWSRDRDVKLTDFYYPTKINTPTEKIEATSIFDLPDRLTIIQGIVGQGKSMFLRNLAIKAAEDPIKKVIPIFIELRTIRPSGSLKNSIAEYLMLNEIGETEKLLDHVLTSGKCVLLLDGFDEIIESKIDDIYDDICYISKKYTDLQIVISSRKGYDIQKTPGFSIYDIETLDTDDVLPFLRKLNVALDKSIDISDAIKKSKREISGLINTPLMLALVAIVYECESEIPDTVPVFFDKLFQVVYSGHDKQKTRFSRKLHTNLSEQKLLRLFEAFCFYSMHNRFGRTLSFDQFELAFESAKTKLLNTDCDVTEFRQDITKVTCLMLEEGISDTTFLHKSIMEYYSAAYIKRLTDDQALKYYNYTRTNFPQWESVLQFLKDIDYDRYTKYYIDIVSREEKEKIDKALSGEGKTSYIQYIKEKYASVTVDFETKRNEENIQLYMIGPVKPSTSIDLDLTRNLIQSILASNIPKPNTHQQNEINERKLVDKTKVRSNNHARMFLYDFIEIFGTEILHPALKENEQLLQDSINKASEVIKIIESRSDPF